ncbi:MAG: SDR family NAD(P)-dependent oxidoreductase [Deltaproteobacteria bacterium]|nr:SDR family NAD(P)-dependent oxidoreductase [Deltaproteobacteria bacterium]
MAPGPRIDRRLDGAVFVVTGANGGVGREVSRDLAAAGATVVMICRSPSRAAEAQADILRTAPSAQLELEIADLGERADIDRAAKRLLERHRTLRGLVNNAAIWTSSRQTNTEGLELTFATNVLAYHQLAALLLPALIASPSARIVNVASRLAFGLDLDDVGFERHPFDGRSAYARSKQADRMLTWALADRLPRHVTANAVHPGTVSTELFADHPGVVGVLGRLYFKHRGVSAAEGADTPSFLAGSSRVEGATNEYWVKRQTQPCPFRDPRQLMRLLNICENMTRTTLPT